MSAPDLTALLADAKARITELETEVQRLQEYADSCREECEKLRDGLKATLTAMKLLLEQL